MDGSGMREECAVFGIVVTGPWPNHNVGVPEIIFNGLVGLQHRGQESSGIVVGSGTEGLCQHEKLQMQDSSESAMRRKHCKNAICEKERLRLKSKKGMGLVSSIFQAEDMVYLKGNLGIGHNRYSTAGRSDIINCQPIILKTQFGELALAHNGEIVNVNGLQKQLYRQGGSFTADSDTEMIARALVQLYENGEECKCVKKEAASSKKGTVQNGHGSYSRQSSEELPDPEWPKRLLHFMGNFPLAYSLLLLHKDVIYAARDPYGNRPLILGKLTSTAHLRKISRDIRDREHAFGWIVASESCCFKNINCTRVREVLPGEIVKITKAGIESVGRCHPPQPQISRPLAPSKTASCVFEYVYFARGSSYFEGQQVYGVRERCGIQLAKEAKDSEMPTFNLEQSIVSSVPDSSIAAALGYAKQTGIPYKEVLLKNAFIGRSFIQPNQELRVNAVAQKFGPLCDNFQGKTIFLIDDSIVRGNTLRTIVTLLKEAGAEEVHVRAACPPVKFPCYMGVNIPTKAELIANQISDVDSLANYFGAASVRYLSIDGLLKAVNEKATADFRGDEAEWQNVGRGHCIACLTGEYPVDLEF